MRVEEWFGFRVQCFFMRDAVLVPHSVENGVPAFECAVRMAQRGEAVWGLDEPYEQCPLGEVKLLGRPMEVMARGLLDPYLIFA